MTSQKSLKNNVNTNDFKRSLIGSILFPAVAFAVLFIFFTIPVIQYVTTKEFLSTPVHNEVSVFLTTSSSFYYMFELIPIGMIACGMLTAVKSFNYLLSKKQVNVFLSLGIKRYTMFANRFVSGIIALFTAVFVPMFIIYLINIGCFGISAHLTKVFLYIIALLFVCGLVGFAVTSAMTMVSGNLFEVVVSSLSLTFIPMFTFFGVHSTMYGYLKGFTMGSTAEKGMALLNPWTLGTNLEDEYVEEIYSYSEHISAGTLLKPLVMNTTPDKFKVPEYLAIDKGFLLPLVLWFVIALVLVGVTFYLFNRRKAEHANSLGKFAVSRAVICTFAFVAIAYLITEMASYAISFGLCFVLILLATALVYFLAQLILTRKVKTTFKTFKWYGVLIGVWAIFLVAISTGFFGTYNRIPDKADVKSVSIEATELDMFEHWIFPWNPNEDFVESSTDESKEAILKVFELLKNEKVEYDKDTYGYIRLAIRNNNGKVKYRAFDIYSEETYLKYLELVYGSDFFDAILKNYMLEDIPADTENNSTGWLKAWMWAYVDSNMLVNVKEDVDYIKDTDGFLEALYKDISVMTVQELFKNPNHPVGIITKTSVDADYPGTTPAYADDVYNPINENGVTTYIEDKYVEEEREINHMLISEFIPVYPQMTNTIKYLEENGYDISEQPMKIKEVLYTDGPLSLYDAKAKFAEVNKSDYKGWGSYNSQFPEYTSVKFNLGDMGVYSYYSNSELAYFINESVTEYDLLKRAYKDAGHPLASVKDAEKAQKIFDNTVPNYLLVGDAGRYVYVVYEEGIIVNYYLPEANVGVVK